MPVSINYPGSVPKLQEAVQQANEILASADLLNIIRSRTTPFDDSQPKDLSPDRIAAEFANSALALTLQEYKTDSSVGGKFNPGYPTIIWANLNAVPLRAACSLAVMLVHECTHALSYDVPGINFSHDSQRPRYNQNTAPYWIQSQLKQQFCTRLAKEERDEYIIVKLEEQEKEY